MNLDQKALREVISESEPGTEIEVGATLKAMGILDSDPRAREALVAIFSAFEKEGLGRFIRGRRGHVSRFVVGAPSLKNSAEKVPEERRPEEVPEEIPAPNPISVVQAPAFGTVQTETFTQEFAAPVPERPALEAPRRGINRSSPVAEVPWVALTVTLREGFVVAFGLPRDITRAEREKLAEFFLKGRFDYKDLPAGAQVHKTVFDKEGKELLPA